MASNDLIEKFLANMLQRGRTQASRKTYAKVLEVVERELPYGLLSNEEELRAWIWRDSITDSSRVTYISVLNNFYRWAEQKQHLDFNPMQGIDAPRVVLGMPRVARTEHVEIVVTSAPQPYRLWGVLASFAGMRCIEVSRSHREDITEQATRINRGKGNKPRNVPTHPMVWQAVSELPPGPLTDCDEDQISTYFMRWCRARGLDGLSMHRLRGWYCTWGYRATKDIRAMQHNMGHADPGTTARYIDVADEQMTAAVMGLPTFGLDAAAPVAELRPRQDR